MISFQSTKDFSKSMYSIFSKHFYFFAFVMLLILSLSFVFPLAAAAENETENVSNLLISNESAVLRIGDVYKFQQGYDVVFKGVGAETILIEMYNNNSDSFSYSVGSTALKTGETVQCYRRTEGGIYIVFMMQLESIHLNNSEFIAVFSHISQYPDPATEILSSTPDWIIYTDMIDYDSSNNPDDKSNEVKKSDNEIYFDPIYIILGVVLIAVFIIFLNFYSKRKK